MGWERGAHYGGYGRRVERTLPKFRPSTKFLAVNPPLPLPIVIVLPIYPKFLFADHVALENAWIFRIFSGNNTPKDREWAIPEAKSVKSRILGTKRNPTKAEGMHAPGLSAAQGRADAEILGTLCHASPLKG